MDPFDDDLLWANYGKADLATFEHPSGMAGPTCWTMLQRETMDGLLRLGTGQELYHKKYESHVKKENRGCYANLTTNKISFQYSGGEQE